MDTSPPSPAPLRIVLIDDEPPAREEVRRLLKRHAHVEIVGEAGNVTAARRRLRKAPDYDLVLLDVQLIGGSGFDLLPDVHPGAHVIFFTAHEKHAVRAFEVNAVDYLLKPVTAQRLATALIRVAEHSGAGPISVGAAAPFEMDDSVLVRGQSGSEFVPLTDIAAIEAQQNYSKVRLARGREILVLRPLKSWGDDLPENTFVRIHRSMLINLDCVREVKHDMLGRPALHIDGLPDPVRASRRQWAEIRNRVARP